MATNKTLLARVPKDILGHLRKKIPDTNDATRFRPLYNSSLFKAEKLLEDKKFTDNIGTFLYGDVWKKVTKNGKKIK